MTKAATLKTAQRAINKAGIPLELERAPEGYHYFIYDVPALNIYETVSVYIPYTSHQTVEQWVELARNAQQSLQRLLADR